MLLAKQRVSTRAFPSSRQGSWRPLSRTHLSTADAQTGGGSPLASETLTTARTLPSSAAASISRREAPSCTSAFVFRFCAGSSSPSSNKHGGWKSMAAGPSACGMTRAPYRAPSAANSFKPFNDRGGGSHNKQVDSC